MSRKTFVLLEDQAMEKMAGGVDQFVLINPGRTVEFPNGSETAFANAIARGKGFEGILNGTAPFFGDGNPVRVEPA